MTEPDPPVESETDYEFELPAELVTVDEDVPDPEGDKPE